MPLNILYFADITMLLENHTSTSLKFWRSYQLLQECENLFLFLPLQRMDIFTRPNKIYITCSNITDTVLEIYTYIYIYKDKDMQHGMCVFVRVVHVYEVHEIPHGPCYLLGLGYYQ